jgi:hypothetical protein
MRLPRFAYLFASLIIAAPLAIVHAVERAASFVWAWAMPKAEAPAFAVAGPDIRFDIPAVPQAEAAVLNALRHEAGMRRLT